MAMGGAYFDGLEGSPSIFTPDNIQTTLFSCPQLGGEVEEVLEQRIIQALLPVVEGSIQRGMQTFMAPLVQAVVKGIQDSIPTLVEAEVHIRMQALMPIMVEEMKKIMMDTFPPSLQPSNPPSSSRTLVHMDSPASRSLQLHFEYQGKSHERIFTEEKLKDQGIFLKVVLKDDTGNIVEVGPKSSIEIQIVVLHSDNPNFNEPVQQREGKPPLLSSTHVSVILAKGVADLDDILFTDNSSWVKTKKFRLGAMVVKGVPHVISLVTIKNAISKDFKVLDHHGEPYQKIENPAMDDKVWRLYHIAKDGPIHKRLETENISSVNDLKFKYMTDPESLKQILNVGKKKFEDIVNQITSPKSNSNVAQPGYQIGEYGGKDAMPFVNGAPNKIYQICETNYQASSSAPKILPPTISTTQVPVNVAAPFLGVEMQLSHNSFPETEMPSQPELTYMFHGFPTSNTFSATSSSTQLPYDVAAPIPGLEMQLSPNNFPESEMPSQPEQLMDMMIPGYVNEDVNWTDVSYDYDQEMENQFQACTSNTQPSTSGLHRPRWRAVGVALRFSVFSMVIIRQARRSRRRRISID